MSTRGLSDCWSPSLNATRTPFQSTSWFPGTITTPRTVSVEKFIRQGRKKFRHFPVLCPETIWILIRFQSKAFHQVSAHYDCVRKPQIGKSPAECVRSLRSGSNNNSGFEITSPPVRWRSEMCRIVYIEDLWLCCAFAVDHSKLRLTWNPHLWGDENYSRAPAGRFQSDWEDGPTPLC